MIEIKISYSQALLIGIILFLLGVMSGSFFGMPDFLFLEGMVLFVVFLIFAIISRDPVVMLMAVLILFLMTGFLRGSQALNEQKIKTPSQNNIVSENISERKNISKIKQYLRESIFSYFPPPQSYLVQSIVLGDKKHLPKTFKEKLSRAGIRHIIVVSGMHLAILAWMTMSFFNILNVSRFVGLGLTLVVVWLFVAFWGWPASAVRAGVMVSVFILSKILGRTSSSLRALMIAAFLMVMIEPSLLRWNLAFQLSFLSVLGLIVLSGNLDKFFNRDSSEWWQGIVSLFTASVAATLFTLPLIAFYFGKVSLLAPLSNLFVVPFLSYIMVGGIMFLIASSAFPFLAFIFYLLLTPILSLVVLISEIVSILPLSQISCPKSLFFFFGYYILLAFSVFYISRKSQSLERVFKAKVK